MLVHTVTLQCNIQYKLLGDEYGHLVGKLQGKRQPGRSRRRWEDNIKMDLQEVGWGLDWIDLTQDMDRWRAVVNAVVKLRVP